MKKYFPLVALLVCLPGLSGAQLFEGFKQWYPIGEDADIHYKTSYVASETILFEGNPVMRYSLSNNMRDVLGAADKKRAHAYYIAFKPQFRMYTDNSLPVKMPTYKIQGGAQWLFKLRSLKTASDFFSVALESGHYSNGQSGAAFSELYPDGSRQGDSIYSTITPGTDLSQMLNRRSGNFSTNITELNFNYRFYHFRSPDQTLADNIHSLTLGFVLYNDKLLGIADVGGYTEDDIKIYGHMRYGLGYEYTHLFLNNKAGSKQRSFPRISLSEKVELIQGAHPWVAPLRSETRLSFTPGGKKPAEVSFFAGFAFGHDNYNYRFVDAATVFMAGLCWSTSPPPVIARKASGNDSGGDEP